MFEKIGILKGSNIPKPPAATGGLPILSSGRKRFNGILKDRFLREIG